MPPRDTAARTLYDDPRFGADLRIAHYHAHRLGLCDADCEDCAMEFLLSRLLRSGRNDPTDAAWRHRCASNFAKNTLRSVAARNRKEQPVSDTAVLDAVAGSLPDPEEEATRAAFWDQVHRHADALQPTPRQMFLRHYASGETVQELALAFGENPHAVEQKLYRARRRFQALLLKSGVTAEKLRNFLPLLSKA